MTETIISLISIALGIIGANFTGLKFKKYSFGLIGNSIAGVFGSIFLMKTLGRIGFDPISIMQNGTFNGLLFVVNCVVSFLGGGAAVILIAKLKRRMEKG